MCDVFRPKICHLFLSTPENGSFVLSFGFASLLACLLAWFV